MTVRLSEGAIRLEGVCPVEDASVLLELVQADGDVAVDLSGCQRMHLAVAQILLAAGPVVARPPADPFLRDWLAPLLHHPGEDNASGAATKSL